MPITILEVKTKKQLSQFINFSYTHYKGIANYVPELYISHKWMLTSSNPFFQHSQIACFLAYSDDSIVGRIAAICNNIHLEIYKDNAGFFGFFESVDDREVANALFDTAIKWLKAKGLTKIIGPTNLTTNDSCGILVDGFDSPPVVLMPYNLPYYERLILGYGFLQLIDLLSYQVDGSKIVTSYQAVVDRCKSRMQTSGTTIRCINFNNFDDELRQLRPVYNQCNQKNWGFVPLDDAEFKAMALQLKLTTPKELALVAEHDGKIVGFMIVVPDLNQVLRKIKNGKLLPFGIVKLLWYKRKINKARILILGVADDFTNTGLDLLLYAQMNENIDKLGIIATEACYVLASNKKMNSIIEKMDGTIVKRYRLFELAIDNC